MACTSHVVVAGYAPLSGTLWYPMSDNCPTANTSLMHFHGDRDKIVPLGVRPISQHHQGDVATNVNGKTLSFCQFSAGHSFKADHLRYAWDAFMAEKS